MESLPENSFLRLPAGALYDIRKIHNLDKPERINQAVDILEAWIQKQNHIIKKDFSREYLERTLVSSKGSVEKSKKLIDRLCTMKTLVPKFFSKTNVKMELQDILKLAGIYNATCELGVILTSRKILHLASRVYRATSIIYTTARHSYSPDTTPVWSDDPPFSMEDKKLVPLPVVTNDYYRIVMIQISDKDFTNESFLQYFQYSIVLSEYVKANDYINGYKIIYDCRQMNLFDVISKINTVELQQFITILVEGYGARLHSIHMLTESKAIELIINIVKQFVSEKIGNRMHVQRSLEDLHKEVPRELLPEEYGGKQKSVEILHAELVQELSSIKHVEYVKMMFQACSDETKRHAGKFNEEYMGMPGAFRNLSVD